MAKSELLEFHDKNLLTSMPQLHAGIANRIRKGEFLSYEEYNKACKVAGIYSVNEEIWNTHINSLPKDIVVDAKMIFKKLEQLNIEHVLVSDTQGGRKMTALMMVVGNEIVVRIAVYRRGKETEYFQHSMLLAATLLYNG